METCRNQAQIRLAAAPPPATKTYMTQKASDETLNSEEDQPVVPQLITSTPMSPLQKQQYNHLHRFTHTHSRTKVQNHQNHHCVDLTNYHQGELKYGDHLSSQKDPPTLEPGIRHHQQTQRGLDRVES